MQAGMLAGWLTDLVGAEHLREYEVRFLAPVFPGDVLRLAGEIVAIGEEDGVAVADISLQVSRADEPVVRARARAVVRAYA
jgi:3-hydroxybutyryl-CoA dehydratase